MKKKPVKNNRCIINNKICVAISAVVLVAIFIFSFVNFDIVLAQAEEALDGKKDFSGFVDGVKEEYASNSLAGKDFFININGLFANIAGRRVCNDVVKTTNDMLLTVERDQDISPTVEGISSFSEYLDNRGISFLYVQLPMKEDFDDAILPEGIESFANENMDSLLMGLRSNNVDVLDLRSYFCGTLDDVEKYFYKTDHHWNADGAFVAYQKITEQLALMFPEENIDLSYTEESMWEKHVLNNWFLGSHGKRVGQYFGGTDDLIWYTPTFETYMSNTVHKYKKFYKGDFSEANIREQYTDNKNYFGENPYCVYIGGDYPLVQHRNLSAPSDLKILYIKDSYSLPLQSFLSVVFKEIDVIDPRHYTDGTVMEYIESTRPDIVIIGINPSVAGIEYYYNFGMDGVNLSNVGDDRQEELVLDKDVVISDSSVCNYDYVVLESNKSYKLTFDDVIYNNGEIDCATVMLYNSTKEDELKWNMFDVEYCAETDGFEWNFKTPDVGTDELRLVFYAGLPEIYKEGTVTYKNISLYKIS